MKKITLLLVFLLCSVYGTFAQVKCATCYQGTHLANGMVLDSNNLPITSLTPAKVTPNGNSSLAQSFILQNVCGLNYVIGTTATATRYSPPYSGFPATINIAGLPAACLTIQKAFLYWGASYTEATPPAVNAVVTNPALATNTYAGANIGQAGSVCWGETGTVTYRADVTAAISGNGAYKINLTGFANAASEVDGLTLIIIYTSPAAYTRSISLWDGCISYVGGTGTLTMNGFTACAASSTASAFYCGGDIQSNVNGNANTNTINGTTATFTNNFWNTNVISPITNLTNGQTTCLYQPYIGNAGDCWFWSVAGLYWQNTSCVVCSSPLALTTTPVNPTCGNSNGSITVGVTGGSAPYTYTWSPAVSTTASATGLSAGTYTITVKDANCNTATVSVTLTTTSLTVTAAVTTNVKCNGGATGSASSTVAGGTAPYTYTWTPSGGTNANATGLTAGTYTITVKDKNGCAGTASVTITQPPALTLSTTVVPVKCNGGATGSATATAGGGTPAYVYAWT
ncbi:MAG TPA: SprB repeat-containing protein, partial [Bacteroidia bacterium]|nr:SprB repeat-containing protein [Bacteroidia bacterium]